MAAPTVAGVDHGDHGVSDADSNDQREHQAFDDRDREILELERSWWKYEGAKTSAMRERFDLSPTRFYQRLNWVIDQPEAMAYDPMTVRRLQRLREARQRQRSARRQA